MNAEHQIGKADALQAQLWDEARKTGAMQFALELAHWAHDHRDELPPHLREELANMIVRAGQ